MHRRRDGVRVVQTRSRLWVSLLVVGLGVGSVASGCATAVDTLEPLDEVAGDGGSSGTSDGGKTSSAGKTTIGGSKSSGGSSSSGGNGGSAGTLTGAFGGSATMGGKTGTGGTTANGGTGGKTSGGSGGTANGGTAGSASGGSSGSGGKSSGGTANGGSGGTANGGSGGAANGGSGGSGPPLACLMSWKGGKCDTCSSQTQSDKLACVDILNCYAANSCGPSTCGGNTDKCGANNIGKGTAGYPIAQTVYDCLCK